MDSNANIMKDSQRIKQETFSTEGIRKDALSNAKYSADALSKDPALKSLAKMFGGFFGTVVLLNAVNNAVENVRKGNKSVWIFSRTVLEFTLAGIFIGFAFDRALIGMLAGGAAGVVALFVQVFTINAKLKRAKSSAGS